MKIKALLLTALLILQWASPLRAQTAAGTTTTGTATTTQTPTTTTGQTGTAGEKKAETPKPPESPVGGTDLAIPQAKEGQAQSPIGASIPTPPAATTAPTPATPATGTEGGAETAEEEGKKKGWAVSSGLQPPTPDQEVAIDLDKKISLDLRDIDILDVLKFLAIKANLNIVGGKNISGTVTLLLNNITVKDALEIILSINRLAYTMKGNIVQVMSEEEYRALFGKQFYDRRQTKIIRLRYASAKNVGAMLENVKSAIGRLVYDDSTGTIVVMDTPEKIEEMEKVIRHEELPTVTRIAPTKTEVFSLQYAKAPSVLEKVTPLLTANVGKAYIDERTNKLVVSDLPHKLQELSGVVEAFDTKTREVFIEAKIIQIELKNDFKAGVDWNTLSGTVQQSFPLSLSSFVQVFAGEIQKTSTGTTTTSATIPTSGTGIILKFLENFGRTNILSTPYIAAISGQEAKIMVGTKEAYTTSSVTQSQATTTTAQNVAFIDVGVTLTVTPTINEDGFITMKIKPEVSSVNRFLTTSQGDQIPIVETTNAETTVLVKDGSTILIGGLMKTARTKTRSGVPVLSRIPVVGGLFRSTDDRSTVSELIVLLTPHQMTGEEMYPGTVASNVAEVTLPPAMEEMLDLVEEPAPKTLPTATARWPKPKPEKKSKPRRKEVWD